MNHLVVLAKHWQPGKAKTRLAAQIGPAAAADVCRAMLEATLLRLDGVAAVRTIHFAPADREAAFTALVRELGLDWRLQPQSAGDLGARMRRAIEAQQERGAQRVVLVGSDSPTVARSDVDRAFALLTAHDVVLGPTADGGYWLLGVAGAVPPLFDGIAWSTPRVWPQTIRRLRDRGLRWTQLERRGDVDRLPDLVRLLGELDGSDDEVLLGLRRRLREILRHTPLSVGNALDDSH